jgi:hypothetical protein
MKLRIQSKREERGIKRLNNEIENLEEEGGRRNMKNEK